MLRPCSQPLRFEPFFRPSVWGGRNLARYLGKNLPAAEPYGESWEISDHPLHRSHLATASLFGVKLHELMERYRDDLLGPAAARYAVFPWLVKLLDACDWLSVQVHPDEETVQQFCPNESAKTEAWYVLDAAPTSRIYAGLKPGIGPNELGRALTEGTVADCLHSFTPVAGDFVYLPAGTVHALGGGILLAEIQQTSDATLRLFDWQRTDRHGKPRPLHIEESLASIHWDQGPVTPIAVQSLNRDHRQRLIAGRYFEIDHVRASADLPLGEVGRLQALIVADGQGHFDNGEFCMPGDAWLLPAALPALTLHVEKPLSGLLCTLPE